jgi:hypothetical protein
MLRQSPREGITQGWITLTYTEVDCHIPDLSQEFAMTGFNSRYDPASAGEVCLQQASNLRMKELHRKGFSGENLKRLTRRFLPQLEVRHNSWFVILNSVQNPFLFFPLTFTSSAFLTRNCYIRI